MRSNRSPFDSAAIDRLRRMGLATAEGTVERDAMAVFCNIFAGQFYDDLCGCHQDDPARRSKPRWPRWWTERTSAIPMENS